LWLYHKIPDVGMFSVAGTECDQKSKFKIVKQDGFFVANGKPSV